MCQADLEGHGEPETASQDYAPNWCEAPDRPLGGPSYNTNMQAGRRLGIELTWPQPPNCCGRWFVEMQIQAEELEACHTEIEEMQIQAEELEACRTEIEELKLLLQTQQALQPNRRWWWPFSR